MTTIQLNTEERTTLFLQRPGRSGGYQNFLLSLQARLRSDGSLTLTLEDLERIPRYAFDYGSGGWENRMKTIFARHLGADLGRSKLPAGPEQMEML